MASVTGGMPKQFWRSNGDPSLLEETLFRVERLSPPMRTTIVVDRSHARYVAGTDYEWNAQLLYQPVDRGTAAGVLLGLLPALAADPDATVLITPSDHGILNPRMFCRSMRQAAAVVRRRPADAVVFGVPPDSQSADFGWIVTGAPLDDLNDRRFQRLEAFVEKPSPDLAARLFEGHGLWSTMIVVARAQALLELYRRFLPETAAIFEDGLRLPSIARQGYLDAAYRELPWADFSRDVLTPAENLVVCAWPASIGWSDLGTPDRLESWARQRRHPARTSDGPQAHDTLDTQLTAGRAR